MTDKTGGVPLFWKSAPTALGILNEKNLVVNLLGLAKRPDKIYKVMIMLQLKRQAKIFGQNAFALIALALLIFSLPLIALLVIVHCFRRWIREKELQPRREMSRVGKPFSLEK
jgi:hypothetical protein